MIESLLARYGLIAIFLGAGIEGEAVVVSGGILAGRGTVPLAGAMLAATLGSTLVDQLWFLAGRHFRDHRFVQRVATTRAFAKALALIDRHPVPFILGFRFVYGMRTASPIALGTSHVPARLFVPLNMLAATVWAPLFTWLGYQLGARAIPILKQVSGIGLAASAVVVVLGLAIALVVRRRR